MAQVPVVVFRKYDIRGSVEGPDAQLTPGLARLVGQAYGTYVQRELGLTQVFVGGDNRLSTPPLKDAIIEGLLSTGLRVTDIGPVMTPTVYFASSSHERAGGIMITGSHLTTQYNGIKMAYGRLALAGEQIQDLLKLILADDFITGAGERRTDLAGPRWWWTPATAPPPWWRRTCCGASSAAWPSSTARWTGGSPTTRPIPPWPATWPT